jgi:hypothetical protein
MSEIEIIYSVFFCCTCIRDCVDLSEEIDRSKNTSQPFLDKKDKKDKDDDYKIMKDTNI